MQRADKPRDIPTDAGVYRWRDADGKVIYVGKAKNLKNRIWSYFGRELHPRTAAMVRTAQSVDWVIVRNEVEALQLEYEWIKEHDPMFNVRFRDDKSYPYLAVSVKDEFPRVFIYRGIRRKGIKYFGPFVKTWSIQNSLDHLLRVFPMRSCTAGVFKNAKASGRPCLLADIKRCSAPCVGRIDEEGHKQIVQQLSTFMSGETKGIMRDIEMRMRQASDAQDYERASVLRDDLAALEAVNQKSAVVFTVETNADLVAVANDELQSAVQIFRVRAGRIVGQYGFIMENPVESTPNSLMVDALMHLYQDVTPGEITTEILVNIAPDDLQSVEEILSGVREAKVKIRVPERGDKRTLLETVHENARQALVSHKSKRSTDLVSRSQALSEIQQALNLNDALLRIECIDISHISGTDVVASLVVFEDGLPNRKEYRHFIIENPRDDTASIHQVVTRRFAKQSESEAARRYKPSLLVIDGGLPQVNAAAKALAEVGVTNLPVVGLAKRMEEIWLPAAQYPVVLPRTSEGLFMLQRLRDEAHRFAINFHREKRSKSMVDSVLDDIPGLGPTKKKALLAKFGSLKKVSQASTEELAEVNGINAALAEVIAQKLWKNSGDFAVNMTTGEIIEL